MKTTYLFKNGEIVEVTHKARSNPIEQIPSGSDRKAGQGFEKFRRDRDARREGKDR